MLTSRLADQATNDDRWRRGAASRSQCVRGSCGSRPSVATSMVIHDGPQAAHCAFKRQRRRPNVHGHGVG